MDLLFFRGKRDEETGSQPPPKLRTDPKAHSVSLDRSNVSANNTSVRRSRTREPNLLASTVVLNQKKYNRMWAEQLHEKEIQELLLKKEESSLHPACPGRTCMSAAGSDLPPEASAVESAAVNLGESNDVFYVLLEAIEHLKKCKRCVKGEVAKYDGQEFPMAKLLSDANAELQEELAQERKRNFLTKENAVKLEKENEQLRSDLNAAQRALKDSARTLAALKSELNSDRQELLKLRRLATSQRESLAELRRAGNSESEALQRKLARVVEETALIRIELDQWCKLASDLEATNRELKRQTKGKLVAIIKAECVEKAVGLDREEGNDDAERAVVATTGIKRVFQDQKVLCEISHRG